jgi:hypothetical protein
MTTTGSHGRDDYYIVGEGQAGDEDGGATAGPPPKGTFRFSRLGPVGSPVNTTLLAKLATAMTTGAGQPNAAATMPAGFTYLGQFIDHDLTLDRTPTLAGASIPVGSLDQGTSPSLDLDSLYRLGPSDPTDRVFFQADGVHLKVGTTAAVPGPGTNSDRVGFDLPRNPDRSPQIPDGRNDENLAVAQTHLAFIRYHNRVVDALAPSTPTNVLFTAARRAVTLHYQWMIRTDYLPRIVDPAIVDDVFTNGRKVFEVGASQSSAPTMPIEFSVAAFRLGHSMVRDQYGWNRVFPNASMAQLFQFSSSGNMAGLPRLPTNWIADFRRIYSLGAGFAPPPGQSNRAKRIDTLLVDPLATLPGFPAAESNLALRNLLRANRVRLASGQQMVTRLKPKVAMTALTAAQILNGDGNGVVVTGPTFTQTERTALTNRTPLWFYILREAELNNGRLNGIGGRIVAETFHRAMEGSEHSLVRTPTFRPDARLGAVGNRFRMRELLRFAYDNRVDQLAPLGN